MMLKAFRYEFHLTANIADWRLWAITHTPHRENEGIIHAGPITLVYARL